MNHVAFIRPDVAAKIRRGSKTIESRLSRNRPPAWQVEAGDCILFKETGGEITLQATVAQVHRFDALRPCDIEALADLFSPAMDTSPANPYWSRKARSRYAVFIVLDQVTEVTFPPAATPRGVRSAWVTDFRAGDLATVVRSSRLPSQPTLI